MGALLAAIVPGFSTAIQAAPNTQRTTLSLALPQLRLHNDNADRWQSVTLKSGQTLSGVFEELGIPYDQLEKVMRTRLKPRCADAPSTALSFNCRPTAACAPRPGSATSRWNSNSMATRASARCRRKSPPAPWCSAAASRCSPRRAKLASAARSATHRRMFKRHRLRLDTTSSRFSVVSTRRKNGQLASTGQSGGHVRWTGS
jgi:hypothetical protein